MYLYDHNYKRASGMTINTIRISFILEPTMYDHKYIKGRAAGLALHKYISGRAAGLALSWNRQCMTINT